jgi:hypothetical protein
MGNIAMVEQIANALSSLKEKVVFVGGSVAELYADHPEISDIRPTMDVDCFIETHSYLNFIKLEEELRTLGFVDDTTHGVPICRKIFQGISVDFMPNDEKVLGFSNRWYADGILNKTSTKLPNGTNIYILSVEYYLATKFEALNSRGSKDIRGSHDWEDIVYIMSNCAELPNKIRQCSNPQLVEYLQNQYNMLFHNSNIREIIYSSLPYHSEEESIDAIIKIMNRIISLQI